MVGFFYPVVVLIQARRTVAAVWLWLPLLSSFLAPDAFGARSSYRTDPTYLIDTWETEDGLPENSATAMAQTPDGYPWFGTWNGLTRFDGVNFKVFNPANTPQLPSAGIVNLHFDQSGQLWVSTLKGLVVRERGEGQVAGDKWPKASAPLATGHSPPATHHNFCPSLIETNRAMDGAQRQNNWNENPDPTGASRESRDRKSILRFLCSFLFKFWTSFPLCLPVERRFDA